jgi:hypothetical protein
LQHIHDVYRTSQLHKRLGQDGRRARLCLGARKRVDHLSDRIEFGGSCLVEYLLPGNGQRS